MKFNAPREAYLTREIIRKYQYDECRYQRTSQCPFIRVNWYQQK